MELEMNEKYYYEPVKDNKYYLSKLEYMDIVKYADVGYILQNKKKEIYYAGDYSGQGFIFKDCENYEKGEGVCYIPEFAFSIESKDETYSCISSDNSFEEGLYCRNDIYDLVRAELLSDEYKDNFKNDDLPLGLVEQISDDVFYIVDWQYPESYLSENDWTDVIKEYFIEKSDEIDKYASEEIKKELLEYGVSYEEI